MSSTDYEHVITCISVVNVEIDMFCLNQSGNVRQRKLDDSQDCGRFSRS